MALHSDLVFRLMTKTEVQNFEIASDAFQTFKVTPRRNSLLLFMTIHCRSVSDRVVDRNDLTAACDWVAGPADEAHGSCRPVPE